MPPVIALIMLLVLSLAGGYAPAQDAEPAVDPAPAAEADEPDDASDDDAEDDAPAIDLDDPDYADLDRQTYEEDDDDFVPTEEIPADEAIPFPTDI